MLKVCCLTRNYGTIYAGPCLYAQNLIDGLAEKCDVTVITPDRTKSNGSARMIFVDEPKDWRQATWIILGRTFSKRLKELLKKESFDVVHFLNSLDAMMYNGKDFVVTVNGYHFAESSWNPKYYWKTYPVDWYVRYFYYNIGKFFEKRTLKRAKHIIAVSGYIRNSIIRNYGIPEDKVTMIHIGYWGGENEAG